jgi:simple sugar transport system permease protein
MRRLLDSVMALAAAFAVSAVIILMSGGNPLVAFSALFNGAFGGIDSLSEVAVKACPLLLAGLAVAVAFRTGVWNIGVEGQLLMGGMVMAAAGSKLDGVHGLVGLTLCLIAAAAAGGAWAMIAAVLKVRRNVNEIISTIMLNFIALGLIGYLVQGPFMEAGGSYPQTDAIAAAVWMPRLFPPHRLHAGIMLALVLAAAVQVLLFRTVAGYEMRAAGLNQSAARLAGIDVGRRLLLALVLSGALAGLAGAVEVSAITRRMYENFSPGWGFTAIAVALLGRLNPAGVIVAAFFFGALDAGSNAMQRVAGVSSVLVSVIQATVILFMLMLDRRARLRSLTGDRL